MNNKEYQKQLKFKDLFLLAIRVFRTNPFRTLLTILGMAVGIGTVLFLVSLGYGLQYILIGELVATEDSLISLEAFYPAESGLFFTPEKLEEIANIEKVAEISPITELTGEISINEFSGFVLVKAIRPNYFRLSGQIPDIGSSFVTEEERSLVISNSALKLLGLKEDEGSLGKPIFIEVAFERKENEVEAELKEIPFPLTIKGIIFDEYAPPFIFIPAEFLPEKSMTFNRVFVRAEDIGSVEVVKNSLIERGLLISAKLDLVRQARQVMSVITIVLGVFGVTALIVAAIGMFNTMVIGFLERIFEVGIMKSLGATSSDVRNLFLMESWIIGFLGGLGGIIIGVGAGEIVNFGLNILAGQLGGESIELFIYPWQFLLLIMVVANFVGIFSGFWPARRAAQLSPKEAFLRK